MRVGANFARFAGAGRAALVVAVLLLLCGAAAAQAIRIDPDAALAPRAFLRVRFEGYLKAQTADKWLVGDRTVIISADTVVIEKNGRAQVGAWVIVWGSQDQDGRLYAAIIEVDRAAGQQASAQQITGLLAKKSFRGWVIGQVLVQVDEQTIMSVMPQIGNYVAAKVELRGSEWYATAIEVIAATPGSIPVEFEGIVREVHDTHWLVDKWRVEITPDTRIMGSRTPGLRAEVRAIPVSKQTLVGLVIRVLDTPAPVTLGALVTAITSDASGSQTWDVLVFPASPWAEPFRASVHVSSHTVVNESRAIAEPGRWAHITASPLGHDTFQADLVRVEQPVPVSINGPADLVAGRPGGGSWWQVDGRPVWVAQSSAAISALRDGEKASVRGLLLGNGVVWMGPLPSGELKKTP